MRYTLLKYMLVIVMVIGSGAMLLDVSQKVQEAERKVRLAERDIERERENIRVLLAEWAYLNDPVRLELMAQNALMMAPVSAGDVVSEMDMGGNESGARERKEVPSVGSSVRNISYTLGGSRDGGRQ